MTVERPVTIGFGPTTIAVHTDDEALHALIAETFRWMPGHAAAGAAGAALRVRWDGAAWCCTEDGAPAEERRHSRRLALRWVRQRTLECIIAATPDLLWLHGAAAGLGAHALVLPGRRGQGKSSLVTALRAHGARFLTDDMLPLDPAAWCVRPFPRTPEVRRDPGAEQPASWLLGVEKVVVDAGGWLAATPLPIGAVLLPAATRGAATALEPVRASEAVLALAEGCWNYADHGARAAAALARLVREVPAARLIFSDADDAAAVASDWFARVRPAPASPPPPSAV